MQTILTKIHGLPEDARKLLAGVCMVVAAIAFFGIWTSFVSSRLVALSPGPGPSVAEGSESATGVAEEISQPAPAASEVSAAPEALSPAGGIADTMKGFADAVSGVAASLQKQASPGPAASSGGFLAPLAERAQGLAAIIGAGSDRIADYLYRKLAPYVPPNL